MDISARNIRLREASVQAEDLLQLLLEARCAKVEAPWGLGAETERALVHAGCAHRT